MTSVVFLIAVFLSLKKYTSPLRSYTCSDTHGRGRSVSLPASMVVEDEDERGDDDVPRALIYTTLTPPRRRVFHVT